MWEENPHYNFSIIFKRISQIFLYYIIRTRIKAFSGTGICSCRNSDRNTMTSEAMAPTHL